MNTRRREPIGRLIVGLLVGCIAGLYVASYTNACDSASCAHAYDDSTHDHGDGHYHTHSGTPSATLATSAPLLGAGLPTNPSAGTMRFVVVADTQGLRQIDQIIDDANRYNPEFIIFPGDLVSTGGAGSWNSWKELTEDFIGGPDNRYPVPGNHDLPVGGDALWKSTFDWLPDSQVVNGKKGIDKMDYFFDKGNSRFISVTTDSQANGTHSQPAALDWLDEVLNDPATQAKEHVFVYSHHPVTFQNESGTGGTAGAWWQTMVDSGVVDAVFAGHWHIYQPSQPDPNSDTWEAVLGTGGGGLEGLPWQNQHGFTVVDVDGPRAEAFFLADYNEDGSFNEIMDRYVIADSGAASKGLVAYYSFDAAAGNFDTAPSALSNHNNGPYVGDAQAVNGGVSGRALQLDGNGDYAHAGGIRDYSMAILGDLTISLHANFDSLDAGTQANTLVTYDNNMPGYGHQESTNTAYQLSIRDDRRLEIRWEHDDGVDVILASSIAASVNPGEWHQYTVVRDADAMTVTFYVDGVQLGATIPFFDLPTGSGNSTLFIGSGQDGINEFDGLIDELTLYNDVILPGDVFTGMLIGDVDLDGDLDNDDVNAFASGWLIDHGMTFGDLSTYMAGDLNFDGITNLIDWGILRQAFIDDGQAVPTLVLPEPTTATTLLGLAMLLNLRRRRPCHTR